MRLRSTLSVLTVAALPAVAADNPQRVETSLVNGQGDTIGTVSVEPLTSGVRLEIHAEGLAPGAHAVHLHTRGVCEGPDFKSAGGHFNPADASHGMPDGDEALRDQDHHAGDMINQKVDDQGVLDTVIVNPSVNLANGRNRLLDSDGTALVVHSASDDYRSQPSGDAGSRVACAVIERRS